MRRRDSRAGRGCDYCADDGNLYFGHVEQIASNEAAQTVLVQCPQCRSQYEFAPRGSDEATRLTVEQAAQRFPR